uniref:Uncharacterized protein n=1 Tax=Salmo trutta TaxID=8032 RepID=A0A674B1H3_SALTR
MPESQEVEGVSDLIIQLKKPLNPVRVSKSHQELHRELRMTHKTWGLHKVAHTPLYIHTVFIPICSCIH